MPRIRTIKPEFFKHSALFDSELESGLPLRVAYAGLWTCCDREGRFKWRPRELKVDILPYDNCDFSRVLDALATRGFVAKYASGDQLFGYIPSWEKHQVINNRESQSILPNPIENQILDACPTRAPRVDDACPTPVKGKGKEGKEIVTRERRVERELPEWLPSVSWFAYVEMRKRIKKELTAHAETLCIKKLEKLRDKGYEPGEILDASVMNDWQGLFIPKDEFGNVIKPSPKTYRSGDRNNPSDWLAAQFDPEGA